MRSSIRTVFCLSLLLLVAACGGESAENPATEAPDAEPAESAPAAATAEAPEAAEEPETAASSDESAPLLDPEHPDVNRTAPDTFRVRFRTTEGDFLVEVHRDWAPRGADRFYNLVRAGFYDDVYFFRVLDGFVAQFGINGDPAVSAAWSWAEIQDDPVRESNRRGTLVYATGGPNTRTTQLFINLVDNERLDGMGFSPFGEVVEGMAVVDSLYSGYGEGAPQGLGPSQGRIEDEGNAYLRAEFPELDRIIGARIEE